MSENKEVTTALPLAVIQSSQSSVEISRGAKGNTTYSVKVYNEDPVIAKETAEKLYRQLTDDLLVI